MLCLRLQRQETKSRPHGPQDIAWHGHEEDLPRISIDFVCNLANVYEKGGDLHKKRRIQVEGFLCGVFREGGE